MRRALLQLYAAAALLSLVLAELLGFPRLLSTAAWAALCIGAWPACTKCAKGPGLSAQERWAVGGCLVVLGLALASGLLGPVNNWDSMTYHLPRVRHWLANGSTALYPTNSLRQLCFPPGSSYLVAQLRLVLGTDRLDFLPQWLALAGLMASVSLSAQRLAGRAAGALGALLVAGIPLAALEATTAQNDLLAALWASLVLLFALEEKPLHGKNLVRLWAALALCAATKPTALLFGGPMLLVALYRETDRKRGILVCAALSALALLPALPHFWRNREAFGAALGIYDRPLNARLGPGVFLSNALRGLALQVPVPAVWGAIADVLRALGIDPNDRATSFTPFVHLRLPVLCNRLLSPDEDYAAAPLPVFAVSASLWFLRRAPKERKVAAAAAGLGLCAYFFLIKWQEWGNRLVLPGLALALPLAAAELEGRLREPWRRTLTAALVLHGALAVVFHVHRPLARLATAPRREVYLFSGYGREHSDAFRNLPPALAEDLCANAALELGDDDWEEPWWALSPGVRFKSAGVANPSKDLPPEFPDEDVCARVEARGPRVVYYDRADLSR